MPGGLKQARVPVAHNPCAIRVAQGCIAKKPPQAGLFDCHGTGRGRGSLRHNERAARGARQVGKPPGGSKAGHARAMAATPGWVQALRLAAVAYTMIHRLLHAGVLRRANAVHRPIKPISRPCRRRHQPLCLLLSPNKAAPNHTNLRLRGRVNPPYRRTHKLYPPRYGARINRTGGTPCPTRTPRTHSAPPRCLRR